MSKINQYFKKWPAGIIELVNVARIIWKVEDPWCKRMKRQSKESRGLETYCRGGQGPPRAVAPSGRGGGVQNNKRFMVQSIKMNKSTNKLPSYYLEIKCQLDVTEVFIADLIACSTCFGHHYAHHQELKSIIQWLLPVVFRTVVCRMLQHPANRTHNP